MDETIRHDTADMNVLTSEDERLLVKFADAVIIEEGADIPSAAAALPIQSCTTPPELVDCIYRLQPQKRLIVVTKTQMAAELARVLNRSFQDNHFALCENDTWDAGTALEEIRCISSMLTDEDGNDLRIDEEIIRGIYTSTDGRLLASEGCLTKLGGKQLYSKQFHDAWGTLLPEQFTKDTLVGEDLSFTTRTFAAADLFAQIKLRKDGQTPLPEQTLVFNTGSALVNEWETPDDFDTALRRLFFLLLFDAEESEDALASMLPALTAADHVPEAFLNDLERIYVGGAACSFRKWNNIIERLLLDYEELGILKGGAAE